VKDINHGLFQPHTAKPPRAPAAARDDGGAGFAWRTLAAHYLDKGPTRYFHEQARVPWLFDAKTGLFVTYDDPESLRLKAEYARDQKLGGVMIWELSHDDDRHSLLDALHAGLKP
jgi:chitinase